jgi:hypothetical protein
MSKKYEEKSQKKLLEMLGYKGDTDHIQGAEEIDIVYSGLDEIMTHAVRNNWEYSLKRNICFRDACFVNGLYKVFQCYKDCGITI